MQAKGNAGWLKKAATALILGAMLVSPGAGKTSAAAEVTGVSWKYQLDFMAVSNDRAMQQAQALMWPMNEQGVTTTLADLAGSNYRLEISGKGSIEQARQAIHSELLADFTGGAAEVTIDLPAEASKDVTIKLQSNPSTGYRWDFSASGSSGFIEKNEGTCTYTTTSLGSTCAQTVTVQGVEDERGKVSLQYRRPFEAEEKPTRHLQMIVASTSTEIDLSDPYPRIAGEQSLLKEAEAGNAIAEIPLTQALPAALDWREAGIVPPIRNQGGCGSCWAFGTVGVMESAIAKSGGPLLDLSEQFLVSCNTYGWSCRYGGLTAHMFHYNKYGFNQSKIGAVLEVDDPYTASDSECTTDYFHPYKLSGWQFVPGSGNDWMMPTVNQIKNAIATYGPVTAGIYVGEAFQRYTGGIFNINEAGNGYPNHQIILVGWNDAGGYWIVRNSWGMNWGEDGYMRITYGTSLVGTGTSWVVWNYSGNKMYLPIIQE